MLQDFIKKRNEEFEKKFRNDYRGILPDEMLRRGHKWFEDFHSTSLRLFAEEIKKEIEKMRIPASGGKYPMKLKDFSYNQALSDLAEMLEKLEI